MVNKDNLTSRQGQILAAIVKEYSQKGEPVGSEELATKYHFALSSATIRNEMKALEKIGFIMQPHTSAGRVPTDAGYRYFVNKLMQHLELKKAEQERLRHELLHLQDQYLELGRSISKLLAERVQGAAFALFPESVSTSGFAKLVDQNVSPKGLKELARFLDELEDYRKTLVQEDIKEVKTFIGKESPVPLVSNFSLVVSKITLSDGKPGLIGIVGPKRMKYARNISLLEYLSKLLSSSLGVFIIISNF